MTRWIIALGLLVMTASASAGRTVELIENSREVALGNVTMPTQGGTVIVRPCDECEPESMRVRSDARYEIGDRALPLNEFKRAAAEIRDTTADGENTLVGIYYDRESGRVTRIKVFARGD